MIYVLRNAFKNFFISSPNEFKSNMIPENSATDYTRYHRAVPTVLNMMLFLYGFAKTKSCETNFEDIVEDDA